jgi:hypothetical protein
MDRLGKVFSRRALLGTAMAAMVGPPAPAPAVRTPSAPVSDQPSNRPHPYPNRPSSHR